MPAREGSCQEWNPTRRLGSPDTPQLGTNRAPGSSNHAFWPPEPMRVPSSRGGYHCRDGTGGGLSRYSRAGSKRFGTTPTGIVWADSQIPLVVIQRKACPARPLGGCPRTGFGARAPAWPAPLLPPSRSRLFDGRGPGASAQGERSWLRARQDSSRPSKSATVSGCASATSTVSPGSCCRSKSW